MKESSVRTLVLSLIGYAATGCGPGGAPASVLAPRGMEPLCASPARLGGTPSAGAPGVIVVYRNGVDPTAETQRLATKYDFVPTHVYTAALAGFSADVPADVTRDLRCEASVQYIEYDGVVTTM